MWLDVQRRLDKPGGQGREGVRQVISDKEGKESRETRENVIKQKILYDSPDKRNEREKKRQTRKEG